MPFYHVLHKSDIIISTFYTSNLQHFIMCYKSKLKHFIICYVSFIFLFPPCLISLNYYFLRSVQTLQNQISVFYLVGELFDSRPIGNIENIPQTIYSTCFASNKIIIFKFFIYIVLGVSSKSNLFSQIFKL